MLYLNDPDDWEAQLEAYSVVDLNDPDALDALPDPPRGPKPIGPWQLYNAGSILGAEAPEIEWVCKDLQLGPGRPAAIVGAPGAGKNDTAQALALAVAAGAPAFHRYPVTRGRVLHLTYDMGFQGCQLRYRRLANGMQLTIDQLQHQLQLGVHPKWNLTHGDEFRDELTELILSEAYGEPFKLCILDNLRSAAPGADENASTMSGYVELLNRVGERTGCTLIYLHHTPNADATRMRGSGSIQGATGTVWTIEGALAAPRRLQMARQHDCATEPAPSFWLQRKLATTQLYAVADGSSWSLEALDKEPDSDGLEAKILRALQRGAQSETALRKACGEASGKTSQQSMQGALERLRAAGQITESAGNWLIA